MLSRPFGKWPLLVEIFQPFLARLRVEPRVECSCDDRP
nr:MAG TPA: hypothetical protein [Caudoviricetes sp.]